MRLFHRHAWTYQERGVGVYQKGNHTIKAAFLGHLEKCEGCGKLMFFPDNPKLRPVPVESVID